MDSHQWLHGMSITKGGALAAQAVNHAETATSTARLSESALRNVISM
jgi:hypothetical protein